MSQPRPTLFVTHRNRGLFSDYYLDEIVPTLPEWDETNFEQVKMVFESLKALRETIQPETLDEAQLEKVWIQPVLDTLGHHYQVQLKIHYTENKHRKPDYAFAKTPEDVQALTNDIYRPNEIQHLLAVGDAKKWGVKLDKASRGERSPAQQIDEYLRYSERSWGILTDGQYWRLYHRDNSKYNVFYEVDLESLLAGDIDDNFQYFYQFFRHEAFVSGWLERIREGSQSFAEKLSDKLEEEVYDALELIAQGFLDYRRNKLKPTPDTLREIYEQSLVLLYRLLFIFYAESREILPMQNSQYRTHYSMDSIKKEISHDLRFKTFNVDSGVYYAKLSRLFFSIDSGHEDYGVPPYNGRLFSEEDHTFLRDKSVGDAYLVTALDKLARVDVTEKRKTERVFVDYRDLEVRHLGSIYEKLLEYELDIAKESLALKNGKFVKAKNNDTVIKDKGQVYLRTGNNERKITGSYYTPDYIVRFIVEKTIEPLLIDITQRYADYDDEAWHVHEGKENDLVRDILALNILDPATGSGHFVVDATSYMAEWLDNLAITPDNLGDEQSLTYWKRMVASACIYAVDINPLAVELAKLSMWLTTIAKDKPLSFFDHHIRLGNSLVGTSLNEMYDDVDEEKRAKKTKKLKAKAQAKGQYEMFSDDQFTDGVAFAVEQMAEIEGTSADTIQDVKQQEAMYAKLTKRLETWKIATDVWTARYFGLAVDNEQWQEIRTFTQSGEMPYYLQHGVVKDAQALADEHHFFHWELAFPEIFFDSDGKRLDNAGFDAVIGNPPYVRYQNFDLSLKKYLSDMYSVYHGSADLFLYFYELGLRFVKDENRLGYITSGTFMNSNSAKPFRQHIHDNASMEWVANFGENQPFKGAEMVYPTIAIMRNTEPKETFNNYFMDGNIKFNDLEQTFANSEWTEGLSDVTNMDEWKFQAKELTTLSQKIFTNSTMLNDFIAGEIYYGILTGATKVFVVNEDIKDDLISQHDTSKTILKPIFRGQDARPWYQSDGKQYLICTKQGINIDEFPAIKNYLQEHRSLLEPKPDNWNDKKDGEWQGRSSGNYQWYEWISPIAYYDELLKPKIIWSDISKLPRFSMDTNGWFYNNTVYGLNSSSYSLLAVLQSRITWFAISQLATPLRLRGGLWQYRLFKQFIERLPIPDLTTDQERDLAEIAETITSLARTRYTLHEDMRQTLINEFNGDAIGTRVALYEWWQFEDEKALSDEIKTRFKQEIPLNQRKKWRDFLNEQRTAHHRLTDEIIAHETRMNSIVYDAFDLTAEERDLIEKSTKYPYGAV